eukprot:7383201-Prymnesium_polylepis.1
MEAPRGESNTQSTGGESMGGWQSFDVWCQHAALVARSLAAALLTRLLLVRCAARHLRLNRAMSSWLDDDFDPDSEAGRESIMAALDAENAPAADWATHAPPVVPQ